MAEKRPAQKGYFLVPKNVFYVIFFYSCLNMLFYERMLLDLGDLLALSLLRNLFSAARSIFPCKYFNCFLQYIWTFRNQFKIWVSGWVGAWIGQIENKAVSSFNQAEVEVKVEFGKIMMIFYWFLNFQIYWIKQIKQAEAELGQAQV